MKLQIEQLSVKRGTRRFTFDAAISNGIWGVFGESGAGKSTLLHLICGIVPAESGRLSVDDTVFDDAGSRLHVPPHRRSVGVVFQDHLLFPHLNVEANLRYGMPKPNKKGIALYITLDQIVDLLSLQPLLAKQPAQLSGGERARVAIGRALLQQPRLLLLDEPFANLDRQRRRQITQYLLKIHRRFHIPLLIISHDLDDILRLTNNLLVIHDDSIAAVGSYMELVQQQGQLSRLLPAKRYINTFELHHQRYDTSVCVNHFGIRPDGESLVTTNTQHFADQQSAPKMARLAIAPDDIALSTVRCGHISMQNQLPGIVQSVWHVSGAYYVTVDCGIELIAEITPAAFERLGITEGAPIVCLFKAKAVDVIHIFDPVVPPQKKESPCAIT